MSVDIAKLDVEVTRWPSEWKSNLDDEGEWCGSFDATNEEADEPHEIETGPDTSYSAAIGKFIADAVNALPVLLEVARTAVAADEALAAFEQWKSRPDGLVDDSFMPLLDAARATRAEHRAASDKLKP